MDDLKKTRTVTVTNDEGFHLRAATLFVLCARRFRSAVAIGKEGHVVDGKSTPLQLVGLGACRGDEVALEATGPDAAEALDALAALFASHFDIEESTQPTDREDSSENVADGDAVTG
ncbi:MAG: HPr family phosphocarrier protein [Pirellulales bacterium]|nr:HPr family phosphocarrier protein [Pirellulales bacterium]